MPTKKPVPTKDEAIIEELARRDEAVARRQLRQAITKAAIHEKAADILADDLKANQVKMKANITAAKTEMRKYARLIKAKGAQEEEAWQIISDLHHCRRQKGIINEQTTAGALATYRNTCDELLWRQRSHAQVKVLNMCLLGDLLHGVGNYAFQDSEVAGNASYQIAKTSMLLIDHINRERAHYEKIRVVCVPGNHGRRNRETDVVTDNLELDMYRVIESYFLTATDVEVTVIDNDIKAIVNSMGRPVAVMHGDFIRASDPQRIADTIRKLEPTWPRITSAYMGHFHRLISMPLVQRYDDAYSRFLYINGTASLGDQYLAAMGSTPTLSWWFNFSNHNRETATYAVDLYKH